MHNYNISEALAWNGERNTVEFVVYKDGQPIRCRVSRECLYDHLGKPITPEECLKAARTQFDQVMSLVDRLIAYSWLESDGSILLRSIDWENLSRQP